MKEATSNKVDQVLQIVMQEKKKRFASADQIDWTRTDGNPPIGYKPDPPTFDPNHKEVLEEVNGGDSIRKLEGTYMGTEWPLSEGRTYKFLVSYSGDDPLIEDDNVVALPCPDFCGPGY